MCLIIDGLKSIDFVNKYWGLNPEITVYKVAVKDSKIDRLESPFKGTTYKIGEELVADGVKSSDAYIIGAGAIHCLLTLEDARKYSKYLWGNTVIIQCKVRKQDFIALGITRVGIFLVEYECDSICFKKVFLEKIVE